MFELMTTPALQQATWKSRLHGPKPQPSNLYFTEAWPDAHRWCRNHYFEIKETAVVPFDRGYILPGNDNQTYDLSNATAGLKLYPENEDRVYEILIGLKPGNYQVGIYCPGVSDYLLSLGDSSMYPDLADATKRYLGAIIPDDSPYSNPLLKLWAIKDMVSWQLKVYIHPGVDFEKVVLGFRVATHKLAEIPKPDAFTTIKYYTEIRDAK